MSATSSPSASRVLASSGRRLLRRDFARRAHQPSLRAKRSNPPVRLRHYGLLRRFAPRNDELIPTDRLEAPMKLTFSPASPFARKVRIAAIELGLIDKIEFVPATVAPGTANAEYSKITPLKKLPV